MVAMGTQFCFGGRYRSYLPWQALSYLLLFPTGALVYELVSGSQLFPVGNNLGSFQAKLASLHVMELTGIPVPLQPTLKAMLNPQPSVRPNANAFTGAPYFQVTFHPS